MPRTKYHALWYPEYHSVCPLVGIWTTHPLSRMRVCPPPHPKQRWGGDNSDNTRLRVRGWGSPISDYWRKKLSTPSTMWFMPICVNFSTI
jgi:hypothetical protein